MLGLGICAGSAVLIALGFLLPGGLLLLIASGFDILDGALARVSGREQRYGAFLELDRGPLRGGDDIHRAALRISSFTAITPSSPCSWCLR